MLELELELELKLDLALELHAFQSSSSSESSSSRVSTSGKSDGLTFQLASFSSLAEKWGGGQASEALPLT